MHPWAMWWARGSRRSESHEKLNEYALEFLDSTYHTLRHQIVFLYHLLFWCYAEDIVPGIVKWHFWCWKPLWKWPWNGRRQAKELDTLQVAWFALAAGTVRYIYVPTSEGSAPLNDAMAFQPFDHAMQRISPSSSTAQALTLTAKRCLWMGKTYHDTLWGVWGWYGTGARRLERKRINGPQ